MNKLLVALGSLFFPLFAFADGSISFTPPPSDYSVVFLGDIFGIVDGVLHGSGSQIMGNMFAIFNAAVLALGTIIIMYTVVISTMNTAHEGQMLGQKWNSIWIPVRSTLGLALLVPKASGYCLMQIFVMWVVLQGVGAADKVWNQALDYLNRGGVIVQPQINPVTSMMGDKGKIAVGAYKILAAQVCMQGLQTALEQQKQGYQNAKEQGSAPPMEPGSILAKFIDASVPNLIASVDIVGAQDNPGKPGQTTFSVPMPNLAQDSFFAPLTGICGTLHWNAISVDEVQKIEKNIPNAQSEIESVKMSRARSLQIMYSELAQYAEAMVNNNTKLHPESRPSGEYQSTYPFAEPYGVPYTNTGTPCTTPSPGTCTGWGIGDTTYGNAALFSGSEFQGAIAAYNGNMLPTLNLMLQAATEDNADKHRDFIKQAKQQGWILAGSYFFDLARIAAITHDDKNGKSSDMTDTDSGLSNTSINFRDLMNGFPTSPAEGNVCTGKPTPPFLCQVMNADPYYIKAVLQLINNDGKVKEPKLTGAVLDAEDYKAIPEPDASTVYGFITNQSMVSLPEQPGVQAPPKFAMKITLPPIQPDFQLQPKTFTGHWYALWLDGLIPDMFYNVIFVTAINWIFGWITSIVNTLLLALLSLPLMGIGDIFLRGVSFIEQPEVNPIVALANMGVNYINFASELWIYLLELTVLYAALSLGLALFIIVLVMMCMPLLAAWIGIMESIGFITAYYVPFLPYMIFTFGSIAWFMAVIEAMVAAPIVALGVTHPEGEGAFGKGEHAVMIIMNVFLRPAMMIIGYIAAIALSYVSVWLINSGFANVVSFIQGSPTSGPGAWSLPADFNTNLSGSDKPSPSGNVDLGQWGSDPSNIEQQAGKIDMQTGYTSWAGIYGFFFSILIYTTLYLLVVQKAFNLIVYLPDKVLRWIGGQPEGVGQEVAQWGEEAKQKIERGGDSTGKAGKAMGKQAMGGISKQLAGGGSGVGVEGKTDLPPESTDDKK